MIVRLRSVGIWASLALLGSTPAGAQVAGPLATPAPFRVEDPSDRGLDANLYMQTSAEYRAACYQAYNWAASRLRAALAAAQGAPGKPPAVVMDLDETVFDNAGFQSSQLRKNLSFDARTWETWEEKYPDQVRLVPGAKEFIVAAEALGCTVIHVSNRKEKYRAQAASALTRLGIPIRGDHQLRLAADTTDKTARRDAVARDYAILLLVGDNLRDFDEQFKAPTLASKTPEAVEAAIRARKDRVDATRAAWGDRWILLPNPAYGEWTRPLGQGRGDLDRLAPSMEGTAPDEGLKQDEAAIQAAVRRYGDARADSDPKAIEALFTPDADQLAPDGTRRRGRPELVAALVESSRRDPAKRTLAVATVRLLSPELAMVDAASAQDAATGPPARALQTTLTLKRTPEGWKIAAIRDMLPADGR